MREICAEIMEGYRPNQSNRETRPAGKRWLEGGIGVGSGSAVPRGEIEVPYYCEMLGLRARPNIDETQWECYSSRDGQAKYALNAFDYDIICQQTYRNPFAIAIQDGNPYVQPAYRWRCYG
jgi:hypothetical protein